MARTNAALKNTQQNARELRGQILGWYDRHRRSMPWRAEKGQAPEPYHVWLSEIMLQQTTVAAVRPYFIKFLEKWPAIEDLAAAQQEDVMSEWAGLGYYARARNLHKCAQVIANELGGQFPEQQDELKKLPGIGEYTSAAITTIAFNKPATVVDGNIERIMARYHAVEEALPKSKTRLKNLASHYFENCEDRPGDFAQALMDIGATICIPKAPRCNLCPVMGGCKAYQKGIQTELPRKKKKKNRPKRIGYVYWIENEKEEILLHRRPQSGLLGGMMALPSSEWIDKKAKQSPEHLLPLHTVQSCKSSIHHVFTHFDLELKLYKADALGEAIENKSYLWININDLKEHGFPSVFQKALNLFLQN